MEKRSPASHITLTIACGRECGHSCCPAKKTYDCSKVKHSCESGCPYLLCTGKSSYPAVVEQAVSDRNVNCTKPMDQSILMMPIWNHTVATVTAKCIILEKSKWRKGKLPLKTANSIFEIILTEYSRSLL